MIAVSFLVFAVGMLVGVTLVLAVALMLSAHDADLNHPTPLDDSSDLHVIRGEGSRMRPLPPEPEEDTE